MNNGPHRHKHVAVLGAGSFGTSLAIALANNHHDVTLWGHRSSHVDKLKTDKKNNQYLPTVDFPQTLHASADLSEVMRCSDEILIVVPSRAFAETLRQIKPYLERSSIERIIWATKGLDPEKQILLSRLIEEILGKEIQKVFITGPSFAIELAQGKPTILTVASEDTDAAKSIADLFQGSSVRTYLSNDIISAQIGGSIKNIIAIATGISDGLGLGANARSGLITRGLTEIIRFSEKISQGGLDTLIGPAGLGDLILTCTDDKSRNRRIGLMLGKGESLGEAKNQLGQEVEGVTTTKTIYELSKKLDIYMPITEIVYQVLYENLQPNEAVKKLLSKKD